MSYYDTIGDDLVRAKEILAKGKPAHEEVAYLPESNRASALGNGGAIHGADIYAAYKLLESFVDQVESYQLLLAVMGVTDYKAAVLTWKARNDELERLRRR